MRISNGDLLRDGSHTDEKECVSFLSVQYAGISVNLAGDDAIGGQRKDTF